jgi:chromosome segregation ATPase
MKPLSRLLCLLALVGMFTTGCATAVDMGSVNSRLDNQEARVQKLEQKPGVPAGQSAEAKTDLDRLEKDLAAVRKTYADSQMDLQNLIERLEALEAYIQESDLNMADLRKKGGQLDRSIENLTNKLEAEIRSLGGKIKELERR